MLSEIKEILPILLTLLWPMSETKIIIVWSIIVTVILILMRRSYVGKKQDIEKDQSVRNDMLSAFKAGQQNK